MDPYPNLRLALERATMEAFEANFALLQAGYEYQEATGVPGCRIAAAAICTSGIPSGILDQIRGDDIFGTKTKEGPMTLEQAEEILAKSTRPRNLPKAKKVRQIKKVITHNKRKYRLIEEEQ